MFAKLRTNPIKKKKEMKMKNNITRFEQFKKSKEVADNFYINEKSEIIDNAIKDFYSEKFSTGKMTYGDLSKEEKEEFFEIVSNQVSMLEDDVYSIKLDLVEKKEKLKDIYPSFLRRIILRIYSSIKDKDFRRKFPKLFSRKDFTKMGKFSRRVINLFKYHEFYDEKNHNDAISLFIFDRFLEGHYRDKSFDVKTKKILGQEYFESLVNRGFICETNEVGIELINFFLSSRGDFTYYKLVDQKSSLIKLEIDIKYIPKKKVEFMEFSSNIIRPSFNNPK